MKIPSCIRCERILDNLDESGNQPGKGIEFTTAGHYGTTKFDPMDGTMLAINLCDDCLQAARDRDDVLFITKDYRSKMHYRLWKQES